jgi:hypothetical protein
MIQALNCPLRMLVSKYVAPWRAVTVSTILFSENKKFWGAMIMMAQMGTEEDSVQTGASLDSAPL